MINVYGYIRVPSQDQNEDRQLIAMQERLVPKKNIFMDKQSGKRCSFAKNTKHTDQQKKERR